MTQIRRLQDVVNPTLFSRRRDDIFFGPKTSWPFWDVLQTIVKRTRKSFNSFNFQQFSSFINDNIEYYQGLFVRRRFCQLQINFTEMASMYIYKLKIHAKLQEKTLARWHMSTHQVPTVSCINLGRQNFVFTVFTNYHGQFKTTKK